MNAVGMATGAVALLAGSLIVGETWALPRHSATVLAFSYLVIASVALFVLVLVVVQRWTASASSYIFVLMPPVAVVLGAALGGEPITMATVLGGLAVLTGVNIGALHRRPALAPGSGARLKHLASIFRLAWGCDVDGVEGWGSRLGAARTLGAESAGSPRVLGRG